MHRSRLICLAAILVAISLFATISARAQETFTAVTSGTTQTLWGVAYGGGQYIAVGEGGTILRSPDGVAWTSAASGKTNWSLAAAYGHEQWVVVGDAGLILTSPDGVEWTAGAAPRATRLNAVITMPLGYFAAGEEGRSYFSRDGLAWEERAQVTVSTATPWLRGLVYAHGYPTIGGESGTIFSQVDWLKAETTGTGYQRSFLENSNPDGGNLEALAYGNGIYVAGGQRGAIRTARTTVQWQAHSIGTATDLRAAVFHAGRFYVAGNDGLMARSDLGESWELLPPSTNANVLAMAGGPTGLVAVGSSGTILHRPAETTAPTIIEAPVNQSEEINGRVVFEVVARGGGELSYTWRHNGLVLTGEKSRLLAVQLTSESLLGEYTVTVSNAYGAQTSAPARLDLITGNREIDSTFASALPFDQVPAALAIQPDDRILAGGSFTSTLAGSEHAGIVRLSRDGALDPSFRPGIGAGKPGSITTLTLQPSGQIVVGGTFTTWNGQPVPGLVRLNVDGSLDQTFVDQWIATNASSLVTTFDDGRFLVTTASGNLERRLPSGVRDPSFDAFALPADFVSVYPADDGGYWVLQDTGERVPFSRIDHIYRSLHLNALGQTTASPGTTLRALAFKPIIHLPDGKILTRIESFSPPTYYKKLYLLNRDWTTDASFPPLALLGDLSVSGTPRSSVAYSATTGQIAYTGVADQYGQAQRIDVVDREGKNVVSYNFAYAAKRQVSALAAQSDGRFIAAVTIDGTPSLVRLSTDSSRLPKAVKVYASSPSFAQVEFGGSVRAEATISGSPPSNLRLVTPSSTTTLSSPQFEVTQLSSTSPSVYRLAGDTLSRPAYLIIDVLPAVPVALASDLTDRTLRLGRTLSLEVSASGTGPFTYQWYHNGLVVSGATRAQLVIDTVTARDAGTYQVKVTGPTSTVTSALATISTPGNAFIKNLSTRAHVGASQDNLIVGFVLSGKSDQQTHLLARGIGRGLAAFGLSDYLTSPVLSLFQGQTLLAANRGWDGASSLREASAVFGAFNLDGDGTDAALTTTFALGAYSATLTNAPENVAGNGLVEVYHDGKEAPWLTNVSSRARVGTGDDLMIAGLVIEGTGTYPYLIRGIGPALAAYGVTDTLADPVLEIVNTATGETVATNDNWEPARAADFTAAGAFPLTAGSKDAAIRVHLPPGRYTALLRGVNNTTGVGLIEIYELP